ncbi:hypothetical protein Bpfe_009632 [Biomphalaria pfeifferi]|uniref:Apple domain-containing protein n=1 Tax=Biomphalaria pfeifferi TaxID=112525 RepID=A0AAD8BWD2_BIOPF|nr:hypothetical protein Bpfe_009632 [Biomphalaria pfeifferi]
MRSMTLLLLVAAGCDSLPCTTVNETCLFMFKEDTDMVPMGCNGTTMWTTVSRSKLSCATACAANATCAVFLYSQDLKTCSMCSGDQIDNLTFVSNMSYSWCYQSVVQNWPFTNVATKFSNLTMFIPHVLFAGSVVSGSFLGVW